MKLQNYADIFSICNRAFLHCDIATFDKVQDHVTTAAMNVENPQQ